MTKSFLLAFLVALPCAAESERETELAPIQVFGGEYQFLNRPMVPQKMNQKKMEERKFNDVNRALKEMTGVYVREEDGYGLRPNIGLRGTDPDRSKKVTLMEDGVLIAPAPYSAPASYYNPPVNHMESLEIYKGFASLPYGPNSVGGAVNYLTAPVPYETDVKTQIIGAEPLSAKFQAGAPLPFGGYLLEGSHRKSKGFKELDGGGDTGYRQNQVGGKLRWDLPGDGHNLLLTMRYGEEESHETYVGLASDDFDATPYRRYASTAQDLMRWNHSKLQLRHQLPLEEESALETTAYLHRFWRSWYKLDRFRNTAVKIRDILRDPTGGNAAYYDILRGAADSSSLGATDGQLLIFNNDRTYISRGVQSRWTRTGGGHSTEVFVRLHSDQVDRSQTSDIFEMTGGRLGRTADPTQTNSVNSDKAQALTVSVLDNWDMGPWTLTPVVRFEGARFEVRNDLTGSAKDRHDEVFLPGVSLTRKLNENNSVRASVNRAATLTGIAIDGTERREEANNYEVEWKYADPVEGREANFVVFYNDYQNITGTCTASSGCTGPTDEIFNGGKALVRGAEFRTAKSFRAGALHLPVQFNLTLLEASFQSEFQSSSSDWGIGTIRPGDPLPYIPRTQYSLVFGAEYGRWKQNLSFSYQSEVFDQAAEGRKTIPAFGVIDWIGTYSIARDNTVDMKVDNLFDRAYAVSSRPYGLRPGKPRTVEVAWTYKF